MVDEIDRILKGQQQWAVRIGDAFESLLQVPDRQPGVHVITDPPYGQHVHDIGLVQEDGLRKALGFEALEDKDRNRAAWEFSRLATRWVLIFSDVEGVAGWRRDLVSAGLEPIRTGAWVKPTAMPQFSGDRPASGFEAVVIAHRPGRKKWNGGGASAVWTHTRDQNELKGHTTQKPLALMLELLELFTDPGDLVIDPFAGSGTTGAACIRLGRRFIGVDRDPAFAAFAIERLQSEERGLTLRDARAGQRGLFER